MTLLEIERKFAFHPSLFSRFLRNAGAPPFTHLQRLATTQKIHDVYFDVRVPGLPRDILARNGIWVRQRNDVWQAKQRVVLAQHVGPKPEHIDSTPNERDHYLRTVFKELSCPREIHALVTSYVPSLSSSSTSTPHNSNFGLQPIANFTTSRSTFLADERFHVVLDETCFGHRVGEVELLAEPGSEQQAQREIDRFMETYAWFFLSSSSSSSSSSRRRVSSVDGGTDGKEDGKDLTEVKGKLTAYFERFPVEG